MQRYHVDPEQASRVEAKALKVLAEVGDAWELNDELHRDLLSWGARVHEIGLTSPITTTTSTAPT